MWRISMFYAYKGNANLGEESCGMSNRYLRQDLKSKEYFLRKCWEFWPDGNFSAYTYRNVYDNNTYKKIR